MPVRYHLVPIAVTALVFLSACAGAGTPILSSISEPQIGSQSATPARSYLWGYWDVWGDPATGTVEVIPLRSSQFTCNVTVFLQPPLGKTANLGISIVDASGFQSEGLIDVDVALTHPFPGLDQYTGFDVMGVFIHHADSSGAYDPSLRWPSGDGTAVLLNADGFTRWYNPVEFTKSNILGFVEGALGTKGAGFDATLNPYKYFCDELGAEDDVTAFFHDPNSIANRGLFSPKVNARRYELQFPVVGGSPEVKFQYAVVASWEPPKGAPPYEIPVDFPISANRAEAFHISVADNGSTLWYVAGEGGGTARFRAEVFDWGAQANSAGVMGEIGRVVLESADASVPGGFVSLTSGDFFSVSHPGTAVSSVVEVEIAGVEPEHSGEAKFLMTVESAEPSSYEQGFDVPVPSSPLAAYFFFMLPVSSENPCVGPVISLDAPDTGIAGEEIEFDTTATTGTPPLTFEWDWDGDGACDETTDTGLVTHEFSAGVWQVGLRVWNECGEDILDPLHEITITCPDEVHSSFLGTVSPSGDFSSLRQDGTAFLPDGRMLAKRQDSLIAFEVTTPGPVDPDVIIPDMANAGMTPGGSWHFLANLDYDEALDRIAYSTLYGDNERVTVYEANGTYLTDFIVPGADGVIAGMDTDSDGSVWCVYHTPGGTTGTNTLTHWQWNSDTGHYDQIAEDTLDCTFVGGGARGTYDIAVLPEAERLYIFHVDGYPWRGAIYVLDISASPPVRIQSLDKSQVFSWTGNTGASISDFNKWEGGSIEVDHGDGTVETCRLIVQHCFQNGGNGIGLMKFDADLNELDHFRQTGTRLLSLAIRPGEDTSDRIIAMPTWSFGACVMHVYEAPAGW